MIPVQVLTIIVSMFIMLFIQGTLWWYKFGKLEEKVASQNARIDDLEDFQKEQIDKQLTKGG